MREEMWSVELEANNWNDDTFNGSHEECIEYCEKHDYKIGQEARIARILVEDGCVLEVLEIEE